MTTFMRLACPSPPTSTSPRKSARQNSARRSLPCERPRRRPETEVPARIANATRAVRIAWVQQYGLTCPGFGREPHAVPSIAHLHADHAVARDPSLVKVLCASCNGRKGATVDKDTLGRGNA